MALWFTRQTPILNGPVFNSYQTAKANGAHFLIARDGKIYQTASLYFKQIMSAGFVQGALQRSVANRLT